MYPENTFFQNIFSIEVSPLTQNHWIYFGIDFISLSLIILTNLFIYLCILSLNVLEIKTKYSLTEILNKLFFIQWGLVCAFSSLDLISFFIFFEATLIPIFQIILQGGSRERKSRAGILIALYTLLGSIFMLFNIIYIFNKYGTTNYLYLYTLNFDIEDQKILWITFFLTFAAKIPVFPFHIWLPEAHVEAPTIGSVLLAALLLKLGVYGLIRFGLPLFPYGQEFFKHIVVTLTICSFFYTNLTAIRQVDIKKIIAYSSVVHMNLIVLGILCLSVESLDGAIYQMIAHGIVSGALFFCIGILYERFKSRFLWYYGGIAFILPIYSIFLFIFILANISFPMTSNFIGEMLLFIGIFQDNFIIGVFAMVSMFFGIIYNMWTYNRISFGNLKMPYNMQKNSTNFFSDINKKDFYILSILGFFLFITGIYSSLILDYITLNSTLLVDKNFQALSKNTLEIFAENNSNLLQNIENKKPFSEEENILESLLETYPVNHPELFNKIVEYWISPKNCIIKEIHWTEFAKSNASNDENPEHISKIVNDAVENVGNYARIPEAAYSKELAELEKVKQLSAELESLNIRLECITRHQNLFENIRHNLKVISEQKTLLPVAQEFEITLILTDGIKVYNQIIVDSSALQEELEKLKLLSIYDASECHKGDFMSRAKKFKLNLDWCRYCKELNSLEKTLNELRINFATSSDCNPCILKAIPEPLHITNTWKGF